MKTILLIEDDADMRQNTAETLELAGYRVIKAENGKQGIERALASVPDLVLCDILMPEVDGYGVLHAMTRQPNTMQIPFVFISAKAEREDVRKGMDMGADDYLTKPFKESELLSSVERRLERSQRFQGDFTDDPAGLDRFLEQARGLDTLKDLSKDRRSRKFPKRSLVFREGDELREVPYLVKGKVRTFKSNKDGKEFTTGLHGEGAFLGCLGLLENGYASENAEVLESSEVVLIPRSDFLALLYRDRDVSACFIRMLVRDMKDKESNLLQLAYASVRQRVAQALLRVSAQQSDAHPEQVLRITREHLASIVGTATESLIRCLSDLREEGLIGINGRDITIMDRAKLEKLAHT